MRVLVVDDDSDGAISLSMVAHLHGFEADFVSNGDLLEAVRSFKPHVLVVDLAMPGLTGFELARLVKADPEIRDCEIIAISGYQGETHEKAATEVGINRLFVKPIDLNIFTDTLREFARRKG